MAAFLKQALPGPAAAAAPAPWANPYQAGLDEATAALNAQQAPMYSEEQARDRQDANRRASRWGLLGLMMGDEGQQRAGGQVLRQAMEAARERITDQGVFDPTTGTMKINPEYARQQLTRRQERLQDLAAGATDRQQAREDQQAYQAQQNELQRASIAANKELGYAQLRAQKEAAKDQKNAILAGNLSDKWEKDNAVDLGIRNAFGTLSNTPTGAAGDLSFVYQYMKMLDPGSVVKETEFANAANAAGVPERIRNVWNKLKSGSFLDPAQRAEFLASAGQLSSSADLRIGQKNKHYVQRAQSMGLDPALVIPEYGATVADAAAIDASMPKPGGDRRGGADRRGAGAPAAPAGGGLPPGVTPDMIAAEIARRQGK